MKYEALPANGVERDAATHVSVRKNSNEGFVSDIGDVIWC